MEKGIDSFGSFQLEALKVNERLEFWIFSILVRKVSLDFDEIYKEYGRINPTFFGWFLE